MRIKLHVKIFILSMIGFFPTSCKEDNVPDVDKTTINPEQIAGGWSIHSTQPYVNVSPLLRPSVAWLQDKLKDVLSSRSENTAFYFNEKKVYFFRNGILQDSSAYTLKNYMIYPDNPRLIGFYAPYYYLKFSNGLLVMYLRKNETIELLKDDGSISDNYMDLIQEIVKDAQCELRFQQDKSLEDPNKSS